MKRSDAELMQFLQAKAAVNRQNPTKQERALLEPLRARGFLFQQPAIIRGARGAVWPLIFDFWRSDNLAVEIDGGYHRQHRGADDRRDRACAFNDIRVLRFTNQQVDSGVALPAILAAAGE